MRVRFPEADFWGLREIPVVRLAFNSYPTSIMWNYLHNVQSHGGCSALASGTSVRPHSYVTERRPSRGGQFAD
jgi:hypothetical protein